MAFWQNTEFVLIGINIAEILYFLIFIGNKIDKKDIDFKLSQFFENYKLPKLQTEIPKVLQNSVELHHTAYL